MHEDNRPASSTAFSKDTLITRTNWLAALQETMSVYVGYHLAVGTIVNSASYI